MTSVEDRKRLKYDGRFEGDAFFALIFSLLGGVTEVGRLALLAIGRSVTRPLPERFDIKHRLTVQTKNDLHHRLAVGFVQMLVAFLYGGCHYSSKGEHIQTTSTSADHIIDAKFKESSYYYYSSKGRHEGATRRHLLVEMHSRIMYSKVE